MGVVAGANEGAGFYVAEAHLQRLFFQKAEFIRRIESRHRKMIFRRPQVLSDCQDVHLARRQVGAPEVAVAAAGGGPLAASFLLRRS